MNKSTLGMIAAGAASLAMVGGGTFAGWSDFNVQEETIQAGHLTLNVGDTDVSDEPLRLAPGDNKWQHYYIASNDGDSVPNGNLTVELINFKHLENGCENNGEGDAEGNQNQLSDDDLTAVCGGPLAGELADESNVTFYYRLEPEGTNCSTLSYGPADRDGAVPSGALRGWDGRTPVQLNPVGQPLAPGDGACVSMSVNAADRGNAVHIDEIQGDGVDFDIRFVLTQA